MQHNLRKAVPGKGRHYENFITRKTFKKCANNLCKYFHKLQVYTFKKVYVQKHFTLFPLKQPPVFGILCEPYLRLHLRKKILQKQDTTKYVKR